MVSSSMFVVSVFLVVFCSSIFGQTTTNNFTPTYAAQVHKEFLASNIYLSFAHTLSTAGVYPGFAEFFFDSAEEEREHGEKLVDFANVLDLDLRLAKIEVNTTYAEMKSLTTMIQEAVKLEQDVYDHLNKLRAESNTAGNYALVHFVEQEMLEEQTTALKYIRDLNERIKRSPNSLVLLQMIDEGFREKKSTKA